MSQIWTLQTEDFVKGLVVAILTAVLTLVVQMLQNGGNFDLKTIGVAALVAGCSYLLKNFATDSNGKLLGAIQIEKS